MPNGNLMAIFHRAHPTKTPFSHSISRKILTQLYGNKIEQAATGNRPSDGQGQATQKHQWKETKRRPTCRPDTKREITKAKTIGPFVLHYPSFALSLHIGKDGTPIHKKAFSNQTNCYRYIHLLNYENPTFIPLLPVDPGSTGQSRRRTIGAHRPWRIAEDQDRTG